MSAGPSFPLNLRGGLFAAVELSCLAAASGAAALFAWAVLEPAPAAPAAASPDGRRPAASVVARTGVATDPFLRAGPGLAGAAPAPGAQGFVLHATRVAGDRSTAILSAEGVPQSAFRIGEAIGSARLAEVFHDRVVLDVGGTRQTISFPQTAVIVPPAPPLNTGAEPPPQEDAARQFGLTPVDRAGRPQGYRIEDPSPALLAAGFETGDILLDINGLSVSAGSFADLQASLASGGSSQIRFERNGQTMTRRIGGSAQ